MIPITQDISLDESEIQFAFTHASGPGGQNINKVATAVQLRFDVRNSHSLPSDVRDRVMHMARRRMTNEGVLVIDARRFRSQERNRRDAVERLIALVRKAVQKPKPRRKTRPTPESQRRRVEAKRSRSEIKRMRRGVSASDD